MNKHQYLLALVMLLTDDQIQLLNNKYKLTAKDKGSKLNVIIPEVEAILREANATSEAKVTI